MPITRAHSNTACRWLLPSTATPWTRSSNRQPSRTTPSATRRTPGIGAADASVRVRGIVESTAEPAERYEPGNPLANQDGNVYAPNVNVIEEMTDMISASRAYQNNVEVMNTSKDLMLATLKLGS
jgi:flagellar basal-body rod protein FlgC